MRVSIISCFDDLMQKDAGASIRILNLARNLALFGHKVRIVVPAIDPNVKRLDGVIISGVDGVSPRSLLSVLSKLLGVSRPLSFLFYDIAFVLRINKIVRESDLIQIEQPWAAGFLPYFIKAIMKKHLVIDSHDVFQSLRIRRSFLRRATETFLEKMAYKCADRILVVSEKERRILEYLGIKRKRISVVPNGVDTEVFAPSSEHKPSLKRIREHYDLENSYTIVFVGNMGYPPNQEAVSVIAAKLCPLVRKEIHNVKFLIVGRAPPALRHYSHKHTPRAVLIFTGIVKEVADFLTASDVAIAPLFHGSGSRLKVIEYFSCGLPVVSTTVGIEGLEVKHGEHLLIEDKMDVFAAKIVELVENKSLAKELGRRARELVVKKYDWQKITGQLVEAYSLLLETPV